MGKMAVGPTGSQPLALECMCHDGKSSVRMWVWMSTFMEKPNVQRSTLNAQRSTSKSEWLDRLRLRDFPAAFLASATRIIAPEIEHRLAEMLDNIAAVEIDVFH